MIKSIKYLLRTFFRFFNLHLVSNYELEKGSLYLRILEKLYFAKGGTGENNDLEIIIFSKDRPIQLHALLTSYKEYAHPLKPVKILYHASGQEEENAYRELIAMHGEKYFSFHREKEFRKDLLAIIASAGAPKLFFLVDDMLFKNPVDLGQFAAIDVQQYVPSLRMGDHLSFSYTTQTKQELPRFAPVPEYPEMLCWDWKDGTRDWNYPLSVDGHLFSRMEIDIILNNLAFKAPNSLESAMQVMQPLFLQRKGLCFKDSVVINNPCNKVQQENNNIAGNYSAKELLRKWQNGWCIDYEAVKGIRNSSAHQELTMKFRKR